MSKNADPIHLADACPGPAGAEGAPAPSSPPRPPFASFRGPRTLRWFVKAAARRPRTTALVVSLLLLAGTAGGLYAFALHQWQAARAAVADGRFSEAGNDLTFCLFVWPRSVPVHLLAARAARSRGDFEEAEAHLNLCLKLRQGDKADIQLEYLLMRVQTGEEDVVAADVLTYVDNKYPESSLILETLTRAYMDKIRYGPALATLDRWVQEEPGEAKPRHWRGWVLERLGDSEGAMQDYRRALEIAPDLVEVRLRLAEMALEKADPPSALPHLERLSQQFPDRADVMALLGRCRFLEGRPEARGLLEGAVKRRPDDPALLITLAKLELQDGRLAEAEQWIRRALKADPTDSEAQYTLVSILQHQDRQEEAAAALKEYEDKQELAREVNRLLQDEARSPSRDPNALYKIGALFLRSGQAHIGEYWLHQALETDPAHKPSLKALAEYYEGKGDADQAAVYRRRLTEPDRKAAAP